MNTSQASLLFDEHDGRILAEAALRSITASTARLRGDDFLRLLVKDLADVLDIRYVIAGRVVSLADGSEGIRTLAVWGGSDYLPNMEYSLLHTPCQDVTDQTMCFHGCGIQADYPQDTLLVDMEAESYIGMPMIDTEGKTLGILSAIDIKPIDENKRLLALSLLSIFAARCAAELQHQEREALLEHKVEKRTEALRAAQANLVEQEKMAALGALVAGVAHEVNTPIGVAVTAASSMGSYTGQMVEMLGGEKVSRSSLMALAMRLQEGATLIEQNLERAAVLIGNFKQLAVDQGSEHVTELALRDYVDGVASAHSPELRKAGIKVVLEIDEGLRVRLPAGKFSQILSNLLMNAARHAYPDGGPGIVTIAARREDDAQAGDALLLDFADDGIGLEPGVRERIFEPFFTTKRGQGGSGLGMHIVYTILHQMGGQVAVDDSVQRGCRFRLRLPLGAPPAGRFQPAAIASATASATLMPSTPADRMPPA
ncbi:MAG: HAMP domain-containing sensor histidine kinase [Pseudomonadota bacterium]